jgi:type VI secretion system protein ImpK
MAALMPSRLDTPPADPTAADPTASALHHAARTLVALASELRWAAPKDPTAVLQALGSAIARFEQDAAAHGCDAGTVVAASYLLCVWVDEVVAQTPWGGAGAGLLQRFHGEADGGEKVFRLLSKLAQQPHRHIGLLQLFHACLSLGLQGHWQTRADGAQQLARLRERLHELLRDSAAQALRLSPQWHSGAVARGGLQRRWLWAAVLALGLVAFSVYAGLRLQLARQADAVFASMRSLEQRNRIATAVIAPAAEPAKAVDRLASLLASDIAQQRLQVRDEAHRSTVSLSADSVFEAGSTRLAAQARPLLARIATAMRSSGVGVAGPPRLLVAAYSDGADAHSVRLPSAWHQTLEWATAVAQELQRELPATAVAIESRGDSEAPAPQPATRRRIEIVLFP